MARADVVPAAVKVRIVGVVAAALALLAAPWLLVRPLLAGGLTLTLGLLGLYILWCLWPRWQGGVAAELLGELPSGPGQRVRLSFDDGPTAGLTGRLLDLLQEHGVRASFFVLLPKARAHRDLIRRIAAEGHLLGLHGEDHRAPFFRPAAELAASLTRARAELESLAGRPVTLYRPSHGWKTLGLLAAVRRAGLRMSFWDYGVWDTDAPLLLPLLERLRAVTRSTDGSRAAHRPILLLHDGRGDDPRVPSHGPVLLAALAEWLPTAGFTEEQPEGSDLAEPGRGMGRKPRAQRG